MFQPVTINLEDFAVISFRDDYPTVSALLAFDQASLVSSCKNYSKLPKIMSSLTEAKVIKLHNEALDIVSNDPRTSTTVR